MKLTLIKKIAALVLIGSVSQFAVADNATAAKTIAGVLASMNHFPSDSDKAALREIAGDDGVGRGFRAIASAVANIQHTATDEDKDIMNRIIASERAADQAKVLAEIVLGISHVASDQAKAKLQAML